MSKIDWNAMANMYRDYACEYDEEAKEAIRKAKKCRQTAKEYERQAKNENNNNNPQPNKRT